ncbi:MAG: S-layer homology domain-containing protein, partial [Rubrobacteridae bacterium]|nr:S-layer homology domain-containing protein [Rubrobacteridae bacterium]
VSLSEDGRYVAFDSTAGNLVADDTNTATDVFIRDTQSETTTRVSVASNGAQGNDFSNYSSISADGRYVVFLSQADNLVAADTNASCDTFIHDTQDGSTTRVSVASDGTEGDSQSGYPSISSDGRYVAFSSYAANLVTGDTNAVSDVFVHDTNDGSVIRVSVTPSGTEANMDALYSAISSNGCYVAFESFADNLDADDNNGSSDVFLSKFNTPPDTSTPTWPGGAAITSSNLGSTSLELTWTEALDNVAVTNYKIYKNGSLYTTVGAVTTCNVTALSPSTTYTFKVEAGDAADGWSTDGPQVNETTLSSSSQGGSANSENITDPILQPQPARIVFSDLNESHWVYNDVKNLLDNDIVLGYGDGSFRPEKFVTRAEFIKTICLAIKLKPVSVKEAGFVDVPADHWASGFIAALQGIGAIDGFADNTFRPDSEISREEMVKII